MREIGGACVSPYAKLFFSSGPSTSWISLLKVPNWIGCPIPSSMAVQPDEVVHMTGNPKMIEAAKRLLCGTKRGLAFPSRLQRLM